MATFEYSEKSTVKLIISVSCVYVLAIFLGTVDAFPSSYHSLQDTSNSRHQRDISPTATTQQVRLHPGVVAAVVIVSLAALVAAIYIIRKYCFPQNDAVYRYSVLRQMEEQRTSATEESRLSEESDEDLLE
ncbi:hypothetical protein AALO_G00135520 [Alosa alosa]|uniref:Uncharacterized protein n=1 Tax=Alosa alosa TaxID=278164 RepID=A0AAV6GKP4_9TELE|nr:hypothetical protein AALO_G00135520 [Alosa alosa]